MKAVRIHAYGDKSVLRYKDAPMPECGANEVVIRVIGSSVNPLDWKVREGHLKTMLPFTLPFIPGWDVSGIVHAVGNNTVKFNVGDAVYSRPEVLHDGTYAEFVAVKEAEVAAKPRTISHIQTGVLPLAALPPGRPWWSTTSYGRSPVPSLHCKIFNRRTHSANRVMLWARLRCISVGLDMSKKYKSQLRLLQIELVKLQQQVITKGDRILVLLEGRDAAGKDGCIKRIVAHLSPRETRVVALAAPSDRERCAWYFARYAAQLPVDAELVLMNRSWYNRAGVEKVMGFCTKKDYAEFMVSVPKFEEMLADAGIRLLKYYLDISKEEQVKRLAERASSPLTQWKSSPIDAVAVRHWKAYSAARNAMLVGTHTTVAPWHIVQANDKRLARLNLIRDILTRLPYTGKDSALVQPDPRIVFPFTPDCLDGLRMAH